MVTNPNCVERLYAPAVPEGEDGTPAVPEMPTTTDPSYFQVEIGYVFGNTGVAVSWYQSKDFMVEGSQGTALGIGARHTLPKAGAEIYTAVQNYDIEPNDDTKNRDETVFVIGTRVKF